ncbi:signal peptide peptidase-domain-containing protein [Phakopsora pachyrhizi]|nr:signal peptide peptidase-domain-containing protein [Phakopsora pachyrhizi]
MDKIYQAYFALSTCAVLPIWYASHAAVKAPRVIKKKGKSSTSDDSSSDEEDEVERMTSEDAYWFPVLGSGALLGLFFVFKYLDKTLINKIFAIYFAVMGTGALAGMLTTVTKIMFGPTAWSKQTKYKLRLTKNASELLLNMRFTNWHIAFTLLSVPVSALQWYYKQWILANIFALSFAFNAITLLKLDSFRTGTILLAGLFIYDVWWVFFSSHAFGESVMVNVAKNLAAPVKITWPRSLLDFWSFDDKKFAMLGLGDIVVPGIFVALSLRFDYKKEYDRLVKASKGPIKNKKTVLSPTSNFPRPYFYTCMGSYVAGLATTMAVMHFFKAAQPALLYLSPACAGSVFILALIKGDLEQYWKWEDGEDDDKDDESKDEKNVKDSSSAKATGGDISENGKNQLRMTSSGNKKKK